MTMQTLQDEEVHLVVSCNQCWRTVRLSPTEAIDLLGSDCTMVEARDRLRCSWCGARGHHIDARPCSEDVAAKRTLESIRRTVNDWKHDGYWSRSLEEAEATWEKRRPKDGPETMCNAFRLRTPLSAIEADLSKLGLPLMFPGGAMPNDWPEIEMTRPTNMLPVLRPVDPVQPAAGLSIVNKRWWLVPFFHRGETKSWKAMCTNARAETVATSRTFKGPFERRRCLVPADAYYEWSGEKGEKTRWRFERADGDWWCFAGLWDRAETAEGSLESFAIVTTEAGPDSAEIHSRQPVILGKPDFTRWLDLSLDAAPILKPSPSGTLQRTAC